jgi:DNA-binding response OmpR family regulator
MVVVDDDSKVRLLLERAFRAPEFETHSFPTGAAALQHVAELRPDCVVSDIRIPDMEGESLVRAVRAVPGLERVPFIALSTVRSEPQIRAVLAAGASAFLVKPFPLRDLIDKVRTLVERPPTAPNGPEGADVTSPTRPLIAAPHTTSTAAVRRKPAAAAPAAPAVTRPATAPPPLPDDPKTLAPGTAPALPQPKAAPTSVRVSRVRIVVPSPAPRGPSGDRADVRRFEIGPSDPGLGFGRFTRVESRGRSFVVLTEAVPQPKFTVTTVIAEKGVPLRKIESALPHPLAREEDRETVRRQLDLQHDDTLRRLDELVLDTAPRRVLWSDQSRSVEAGVLAWAMSAVAQLAETQAGTDETARHLRRTREAALADEDALRAFKVTPFARVVVDPKHAGRVPRRAVRAAAGWCRAFATAALRAQVEEIVGPVRQATRRYSLELERMGFYDRLLRRAKA